MNTVSDLTPSSAPADSDWGSRNHLRTLVLLAATLSGIVLCYLLALPFLSALVWALALAVVFAPFHRWVEAKVRRPNLAAFVSVLAIGVVVFGLSIFVTQRLVQEASKGADLLTAKIQSGEWKLAFEANPRLAPLVGWMERLNLPETLTALAGWVSTTVGALVKGSAVAVLVLLLTFYLLFFLLRDRQLALRALRSLAPLSAPEIDRLCRRVGETIHATIYGTVVVSAVQGLLGGLMFWWLGLPNPLLWGVVMAVVAVVPVLGAFVVWVPAAAFLVLNGSWIKGLILAVWGVVVVSSADNLLLPILVGKRLRLHTVIAFISAVGGLVLFGAAGLVLGPVVFTITKELLAIWRNRLVAEAPTQGDLEDLIRLADDGGPAAPE
jgi:predicted PurR-regulated permease PerM